MEVEGPKLVLFLQHYSVLLLLGMAGWGMIDLHGRARRWKQGPSSQSLIVDTLLSERGWFYAFFFLVLTTCRRNNTEAKRRWHDA